MCATDAKGLINIWIKLCREAINEYLQDSREKSLALTKLDECEMWAEKCALVDDNVN